MHITLSSNEIAERGERIYIEQLRNQLEIPENIGKMLVLDILSGDYEIDSSGMVANDRIEERHPDGIFYGIRIGFAYVEEFSGPRWEESKT